MVAYGSGCWYNVRTRDGSEPQSPQPFVADPGERLCCWCASAYQCLLLGVRAEVEVPQQQLEAVMQEPALNALVAVALQEQRLLADPEEPHRSGKVPDIRVRIPRSRSSNVYWRAVEAKVGTESANRRAAAKHAAKWQEDAYCEATTAVCYPKHLTEPGGNTLERVRNCKEFVVSVIGDGGQPREWKTVDIQGLADEIRNADKTGGARIAATIADGVNDFVIGLNGIVKERLRAELQMPDADNAAAVVGLLLMNMAMLQSTLAEGSKALADAKLKTIDATLRERTRGKQGLPTILETEWEKIRKVNYDPIVTPSLRLIGLISGADDTPLFALLQQAKKCAPMLSRTQLDYAGPVYHGLLESRYDGSFYTNTSAAVLLAELAIPDNWCDWKDWRDIAQKTICDPACGTGTLLMAVQKVLIERLQKNGGSKSDIAELQRALIERSLFGLDINAHALHLAACMLTLASGNVEYQHMQLHRMPHGTIQNEDDEKEETRCGSLEILVGNALALPGWGLGVESTQHGAQGEVVIEASEAVSPESMDLTIMNPPFTRHSIRNDQLDERTEVMVRDRENFVANNATKRAYRDAINRTSVETYFAPIADTITKPGGIVASVKPFAFCCGAAAEGARRLWLRATKLKYIITTHDNSGLSFSGNTSIHETLLIAEKREQMESRPGKSETVKFVTLLRNPKSTIEMTDIVKQIRVGEGPDIRTTTAPAADLMDRQWYEASFANPKLVSDFETDLRKHPDMVTLDDLADYVGPAPAAIRLHFENSGEISLGGGGEYHGMWYHPTKVTTTMQGKPDSTLRMRSGKERYARTLWDKRSSLLIAEKLQPNLARVTARWSTQPTVGSAWGPVTISGEDAVTKMKAVVVYLNSTAGLLGWLVLRGRKLTYPIYSLTSQRLLPVPKNNLTTLAATYDELRVQELLPIPQLTRDPVRLQLDDAVAKAVPHLATKLPDWRKLIASEPTVNGKKSERTDAYPLFDD